MSKIGRAFLRFLRSLSWRGRSVIVLTLVGAAMFWLWYSAYASFAYYFLITRANNIEGPERHLALSSYNVVVERKPIAGLSDNVSGLTFSQATGTLFTVINRKPEAAELSVEGDLLRRIPIIGGRDPEGITHVEGDMFIIADESDDSLHLVRIGPGTDEIILGEGYRLRLDIGAFKNMSLEGLSWDSRHKRLFAVQEMLPLRVLAIGGLIKTTGGELVSSDIQEWHLRDLSSLFTLDLSSVALHEQTESLLLLSHLSAMLVEYSLDGRALGMMSLLKGHHGLTETVGEAEGVAVGRDGDIFIVSEPNLFYRFKRCERSKVTWGSWWQTCAAATAKPI